MTFDHLSSHALTARLDQLLANERQTVADFLLHLVEFDRRRLHLELGFSSLFKYCVERLKLSKGATFRRTEAVRLIARYPEITDYLRDGPLSLTTLVELRYVLDGSHGDYRQILDRAAGKTEEQVRALVAALDPHDAPPDLFRRLPVSTPKEPAVRSIGNGADDNSPGTGPVPAADSAKSVPMPSAPGTPPPPATLRPISEELRVLRITVGSEFADDLARAKALLSHTIPDGNLAQILHACIRHTIAYCEKRRRGSERPRPRKTGQPPAPRPASPRPTTGRSIPVEVRREVWRRDGGACVFIASDGKRCGSTHRVEFHHLHPYARGGSPTVENLQLRCKPHNLHAAEADFGRDVMRSFLNPQPATCDES